MTKNDYFNSLSDELKKFCKDKKFYPTNDKEFNDFVRSYCELDNLKDFSVEVRESEKDENESTILVPIFCKRPFYAFVFDVWNAMTDVQRVQAIAMAYNYICNEISPRLTKKIQLTFIDSDLSREWLGCFNSDINQMYISLTAILSPYGYASRFLAAIKHELTHAEQYWERKKNLQYVKSQNYDFSKLSSYQKKLFLSGSGEFGYYVDYLYKQVSQGMETTKYLSNEDKTLWLKLEAEDNNDWRILKRLIYACCPIELAAENKTHKFLEKISKIYPMYVKELVIDFYIDELKEDGYEISHNDIENFTQMSCITDILGYYDFKDVVEILFEEIAYMLNIYRTKKVEKPFMENYEDFENEFFKDLQEVYQEKNAKENQQEE